MKLAGNCCTVVIELQKCVEELVPDNKNSKAGSRTESIGKVPMSITGAVNAPDVCKHPFRIVLIGETIENTRGSRFTLDE